MSSKLVLLSVLRSTLSTLSETSNGVHPPLAVYSSALSALEARLESHSQFLHKSSSVIQSRYRGIKTRSTLKSQNDAAKILQSRHRTSLAKSRVSAIKSERQTEQVSGGGSEVLGSKVLGSEVFGSEVLGIVASGSNASGVRLSIPSIKYRCNTILTCHVRSSTTSRLFAAKRRRSQNPEKLPRKEGPRIIQRNPPEGRPGKRRR